MKKISIHSNPEYDYPNKDLCILIIKNIFKSNKINLYDISIIFTSDIFVSDLKKKFFSKNQWTDVIAFPLHNNKDTKIEGDIYISMPTAIVNADKYNEPYEKEVARLMIHGVLHLIGFSDDTKKEKDIMSKIEDRLLKETKWKDLFEK
ncbi:MAG: rRNA maturation RNase YbeY [Candidatus Neomarinimicrobiota bacterium]|nr:rRNA maturation RNase YbeY [Candidatus Neomarinimicrobiota bacterium]MED5553796.1 rRNA maturation RNase YbeY [Candidatus Neomarinimicrobiota bacterium]